MIITTTDSLQFPLEEEIVKIDTINIKEQIFKNVVITFSELHIITDLNVLFLLLTSSLRDSDPRYPFLSI